MIGKRNKQEKKNEKNGKMAELKKVRRDMASPMNIIDLQENQG